MKTYRLSARIDEETRRKLERRAHFESKDESAIVREALSSYLSNDVETAYETVLRIGGLGVAKGLPADLSTNKKYFEGFGSSDQPRASRHRTTRRSSRK
jgi:predicted transcriptional regulator